MIAWKQPHQRLFGPQGNTCLFELQVKSQPDFQCNSLHWILYPHINETSVFTHIDEVQCQMLRLELWIFRSIMNTAT